MPRRNRVDPWGDLHAVPDRGMFTGNRGCLVADSGALRRHHNGSLWISCLTKFRDWKHPLDAPRTWTPLFFLDEAVALAAGHRPCGLCRRADYLSYRTAVTNALGRDRPVLAKELNRRLASERLSRGRGMSRALDRKLGEVGAEKLPPGTVVADKRTRRTYLVDDAQLRRFGFSGWSDALDEPDPRNLHVLTPPTSLAALQQGYEPKLSVVTPTVS
jgi:hypothetical protein